MMAYPEITDPAEAKAKFIEAVTAGDTAWLQPVADAWNTGYQVTDATAAVGSAISRIVMRSYFGDGPHV